MSVSRYLVNIFIADTSVVAKGAVRSSIFRSQGVYNFVFIRRYKSAYVEFIEASMGHKKSRKITTKADPNHGLCSHFYVYLMTKELFKKCLRELFSTHSLLAKISNYIKWKRIDDAGLTTSSWMHYNDLEQDSLYGKKIESFAIHKNHIIDKI